MGMTKDYKRHSRKVTKTKRWKALRLEILRRDGWACVQCGDRRRLEIDHILPVKTHPELSFEPRNLQALCCRCHARKTRLEVGHKPLPPKRQEWRDLLQDAQRNPTKQQEK